jgi:hypothetical protein
MSKFPEITRVRIADNSVTKAHIAELDEEEKKAVRRVVFVTDQWVKTGWFKRQLIKLKGAESFIKEQEHKFKQIEAGRHVYEVHTKKHKKINHP